MKRQHVTERAARAATKARKEARRLRRFPQLKIDPVTHLSMAPSPAMQQVERSVGSSGLGRIMAGVMFHTMALTWDEETGFELDGGVEIKLSRDELKALAFRAQSRGFQAIAEDVVERAAKP